mgnify:CR=1 FL=1
MTAIYKKELKSYLTSMIGYLFMAFTLALFGLYFTAINLQQGYPEIGYALQNSAFILLIAVPVLTMRVLSEEQKNKTDQLLLTAPVKISDIILGKYLALLTIYVIPVLIMCLYPLLLGIHGTVSYAVSYTSILGYFLLGAAYISVGVFVSSITESQVIAAVVGFVILFLCYVESGIANFFPEGAGSSFFAFFIIIALVCLWIGSMIKNPIITGVIAVIGEGALTAWGTVSSAAVSTAAIMAVFPKVAGIFASAFTTLTDAYKSKAAKSGEGREWYLSVNDACGYGEPNTLVTGILLIPIMLVVAFVLPGNTILPMADLCALPYMVEVFVCVSNGNIAKSVVSGAIWFSLGLVVASVLAPTFTQVAVDAGFQLAQEGVFIISFGIMCHPLIAGLFYAFWSQNPIIIGAVVIAYFVLYFLFKKNKERFVGYLENAAAAYSAY